MRGLTSEEIELIRENRHRTISELKVLTGRSTGTVSKYLRLAREADPAMTPAQRVGRRPRISTSEIELIHVNRHLTIEDLRVLTGRSAGTVARYLRQARAKNPVPAPLRQERQIASSAKRTARSHELTRSAADEMFERYRDEPSFLIGLSLYWAEGTRSGWTFSNTDPKMILTFLARAEAYLPHSGRTCWVPTAPGADQEKCVSYWRRIVGPEATYRSQVSPNTRHPRGVCNVTLNGAPKVRRVFIARLLERLGDHLSSQPPTSWGAPPARPHLTVVA